MISYLMVFHGIISILLILTVLLQFGRGAEAGLISGGASEAVFSGAQRGNILSKITSVLAILFLGNSIVLAKLESTNHSTSLLDKLPVKTAPIAPKAVEPKAAQPKDAVPKAPEQKK